MFTNVIALGGARRLTPTRRGAGPDAAPARAPLICRWSPDPATGKLVATWIRASDADSARESQPSRLRMRPLRPRPRAA